ncbi:hypothetical protein BYT27DRAFT_7251704 [Phlegmacium glaucopus]|nr:hypothetical protein BYT27DRAFT_7251704 [Phlegmacium glaucopus]
MASFNERGTHSTQPVPVAEMTLPTPGNRNVLNLPLDSEGKRPWSFGLLSSCEGFNKCCVAYCYPRLVNVQNQRRLEHLSIQGIPDPQREKFITGGLLQGTWVYQLSTRKNIRERYSIRGNAVGDFCAVFWCRACDLMQVSRELQLEEESFGATQ